MKLKAVRNPEDAASSDPVHPRLLSAFSVGILLLATISLIALVASGAGSHGAIPWTLIAFVVLTVFGTHSEEVFGDETAINGSILVIMAGAGIAFAGGSFWVITACGLVAGLHWYHIRDRALRKLLVNTSFTTLAAVAAAEVARLLAVGRPSLATLILCGLAAVMAYWLTDNVLVAIVLSIVDGRPVREHARDLVRSETEVIPFALVGFICGYIAIAEIGWLGILGTISLLVLAEAFVFRSGGSIRWCCQWLIRLVPVGLAIAVLISLNPGKLRGGALLAAFGVAALLSARILDRRRTAGALFALVVCAVGACVALPGDPPIAVALIVGFGTSIGLAVRRREPRYCMTAVSASACASLAVGGVLAVLGTGLPSVGAGLLLGLSAGLGGLVAWHAVMGATLLLDVGPSMAPSIGTVLRSDTSLMLVSGLSGVGVGCVGRHLGIWGIVATLGFAVGYLLIALTIRRRSGNDEPELTGEELLDVLRSALLDMPASRLPD